MAEKKQILLHINEDILDLIDDRVYEMKETQRGYNRTQFFLDMIKETLGTDDIPSSSFSNRRSRYSIEDLTKKLSPGEGYPMRELIRLSKISRGTILKMLDTDAKDLFTIEENPLGTGRIYVYLKDQAEPKPKRKRRRKAKDSKKKYFHEYTKEEQDRFYEKKHQRAIQPLKEENEKLNWQALGYDDSEFEKYLIEECGAGKPNLEAYLGFEPGEFTREEMITFLMSNYFESREGAFIHTNEQLEFVGEKPITMEEAIKYVDFEGRDEILKDVEERMIKAYDEL